MAAKKEISEKDVKLLQSMASQCVANSKIDPALYQKYDVKRGLRDISGQGVLTGLTEVSEIRSYTMVDRDLVPCEGKLFYQGIDVEEIVEGCVTEDRFGFEEVVYLLLFGKLPDQVELDGLNGLLARYREEFPTSFVRDIIMKASSPDVMNMLARSVLTLYSYDEKPEDVSVENVLRQSLELIALFPILAVYAFHSYNHYHLGKSLVVHSPRPDYSTAQNILHLLRPDSQFTDLEAKILDIALILHAEHGGGNNSTFTTHVVTSSGTDTYSSIAASLGSLKGPKHGGANIKVVQMMEDMKKNVKNWGDEGEVRQYLVSLLKKEAFDKAGLIYGMGHAVYSLSDPRANVFKQFVEKLSKDKHKEDEFELYSMVERLAPEVIAEQRRIYKGVSANVDFYSGFVYNILDLPGELFTPIFAIARIAGWSAHRLEELINAGKIIRPAYKSVATHRPYVKVADRTLT